jgi:HAD superfamily hydrolase (TIGR01509 family)
MDWIYEYDLFLFDFDGLLVHTEPAHFRAYQKMCKDRGFTLPWDFNAYCQVAHRGAECLKWEIYRLFPALFQQEPNWSVLYQEKKRACLEILFKGDLELLPGVEKMLVLLEKLGKRRCVVTHSLSELTNAAKSQIHVLQTIPYWVTREQYQHPKPAPDPYLEAVRLYAKPEDRIIGFEDTVRGWKSLQAASIQGVVVSSILSDEFTKYLQERKALIYRSFEELLARSSL